uniref:Conopeptide n=1 Tax=Conus lenavati TaxID=1519839 RepID=A0A0K8TUC0_CONLV
MMCRLTLLCCLLLVIAPLKLAGDDDIPRDKRESCSATVCKCSAQNICCLDTSGSTCENPSNCNAPFIQC